MIDLTTQHWCVCTLCGSRNNENGTGHCINGHDSWLELRDFLTSTEIIRKACHAFDMDELDLEDAFLNPLKTQFKVIHPIQL